MQSANIENSCIGLVSNNLNLKNEFQDNNENYRADLEKGFPRKLIIQTFGFKSSFRPLGS